MNSARKFFLITLFLCSVLGITFAQEETGEIPALNWKMALLKKNGAAYESVAFNKPLIFNRKDAFQVYLSFGSTGYCYVIQEDDGGKLPLIYRKNFSPGDQITLPEGSNLPEGGNLPGTAAGKSAAIVRDFRAAELVGTSRIYVIVSAQPRQNLERLLDQYQQEGGTASLERSVLAEVFAIRRNISPLPEPVSEAPDESSVQRRRYSTEFSGTPVSPAETDRAMKGQLWLFEDRNAWVITAVVRVK